MSESPPAAIRHEHDPARVKRGSIPWGGPRERNLHLRLGQGSGHRKTDGCRGVILPKPRRQGPVNELSL